MFYFLVNLFSWILASAELCPIKGESLSTTRNVMYAVTVGVDTGTSLLHRVEEDVVVSREFASEKLDDFSASWYHIWRNLYMYTNVLCILWFCTFLSYAYHFFHFMFVLFRCVKRSSLLALVYMYMHIEQVNYNRMDLLMLMCTVVHFRNIICSFRCETQLTKLDWG